MGGWLNYDDPDAWINRVRRRRAVLFRALLETLPVSTTPVTLLDVGGTYHYWRTMGLLPPDRYRVTLLNLSAVPLPPGASGFASLAGDARALPFAGGAFDVVFSNSVIEHMGSRAGQQRMAAEVRRVGRRYYVQTPAKWFPIEPHCHLPLFQFLPRGVRALLIRTGRIHYFPRGPTLRACAEVSDSTILLGAGDMRALFPGARLVRERLGGLVKSYTAVGGGWPAEALAR